MKNLTATLSTVVFCEKTGQPHSLDCWNFSTFVVEIDTEGHVSSKIKRNKISSMFLTAFEAYIYLKMKSEFDSLPSQLPCPLGNKKRFSFVSIRHKVHRNRAHAKLRRFYRMFQKDFLPVSCEILL